MKNFSEEARFGFAAIAAFIIPLLLIGLTFTAKEIYNTQQDRQMFLKSYEIVLGCRERLAPNVSLADEVCGTVPVFLDITK